MRRSFWRKVAAGMMSATAVGMTCHHLSAAEAGAIREASHTGGYYNSCPCPQYGHPHVQPGPQMPGQPGVPALPPALAPGDAQPSQDGVQQGADQGQQPFTAPQDVTQEQAVDLGSDSLSSATGGAESASSGAPNMIGDFFTPPLQSSGSGCTIVQRLAGDIAVPPIGAPGIYSGAAAGSGALFTPTFGSLPFGSSVSVTGADLNYSSAGPVPGGFIPGTTNNVALAANPAITQALVQASPGASGAVFNGGQARLVTPGALPPENEYIINHDYSILFASNVCIPNTGGLVVGRSKVSDNNSAMPRCRVFLDYNYYDNVPLAAGGVNVKRFTPGFEKAFGNGRASVEVRAPMAITLSSDAYSNGANDLENYELGDVTFVTKLMLYQNCATTISCGSGITVPTADDFRVNLTNGSTLVNIDHQSVHLTPYLAILQNPGGCFYSQAFAIVDFDTNGDDVEFNRFGQGLRPYGTLQDQTIFHLDYSLGYWAYQNPCACSGLSAVALTGEAHYSTNLNDADGLLTGGIAHDWDVLNLTVGAHLMQACGSVFTFAYGVPVTDDQSFDGELRVMFNQYF